MSHVSWSANALTLDSALGSWFSDRSETKEYNKQISMRKRQLDAEYQNKVTSAIQEMQTASLSQQYANDSSTQQKLELAREMLAAREQSKAAASMGGVAGNSLQRTVNSNLADEQLKRAGIETERQYAMHAGQLSKSKAVNSTKSTSYVYAKRKSGTFLSHLSASYSSLGRKLLGG